MALIYAYIKKTENKVVYVGQTTNLKHRRYCHEVADPFHENLREYNYPLSRGIRKYGIEEYECKILEDNISKELIDEREIYWINYYNTYNDPSGYNLTPGGKNVSGYYKFNSNTIQLAKDLLRKKIPFADINAETGISIVHLSEINWGRRHFDENETYPINNMTKGRKTTDEQVEQIYLLLKKKELTIKEISEILNVNECIVSSINLGKCFRKEGESYPLRQRIISGKRNLLSEENLKLLINDIVNTKISFSQLSKKYHISTTTVYNINSGQTRKQKDLIYPLRK